MQGPQDLQGNTRGIGTAVWAGLPCHTVAPLATAGDAGEGAGARQFICDWCRAVVSGLSLCCEIRFRAARLLERTPALSAHRGHQLLSRLQSPGLAARLLAADE